MDFTEFNNLTLADLIDVNNKIDELDEKEVSQYYKHIKKYLKEVGGLTDLLRTKILEFNEKGLNLEDYGIEIRTRKTFNFKVSMDKAKAAGLEILTHIIPERQEVDSTKMKALFKKDDEYKQYAEYSEGRSVYTK